jgi:ribosomal protein S8
MLLGLNDHLGDMKSLLSFIVSVNQAVSLRRTTCLVPLSGSVKKLAIFFKNRGYFSSVVANADCLVISLRYVNNVAPFHKLVIVSTSSRAVYFSNSDKTPGVFLVSNSDSALSLRGVDSFATGRVLLQIF